MATVANKGMPPRANDRHIPTGRKSGPALRTFSITPSDITDLNTPIRAVRVAGAGNVAFQHFDGSTTVVPAAADEVLTVEAVRVLSTGTTATGIIGYA